jgi:alanine racemase
MSRPLREARINLAAISHNVEQLRRTVAVSNAMAIVKANAYGHGAVPSALAALAGGANWLGVADLEEALALRAAGITAPVLAWLHSVNTDFAPAIEAGIDVGVNYLAQLERVAAAASSTPARIQLKLDTGLGRNGAIEADDELLFARAHELQKLGRVRITGIFSHLADVNPGEDLAQVARFDRRVEAARAVGLDPEFVHLAATGGALRIAAAQNNLIRLGIGTYGLSPGNDSGAERLSLVPAMEVSAEVVAVKRVPAGSGVSYGHTHLTSAPTTLALIPLGYADGIPRHASGAGPVSINGNHYRVSGRIAMDQFVVDVGDASVAVGDRAVLFGDPAHGVPTADEWALSAKTINYEIVSRIGNRVTRSYPS